MRMRMRRQGGWMCIFIKVATMRMKENHKELSKWFTSRSDGSDVSVFSSFFYLSPPFFGVCVLYKKPNSHMYL